MEAVGHPVVAQVAGAEDIRVAAIPVEDTLVEVTPAAVIPVVVILAEATRAEVAGLTEEGMPAGAILRRTKNSSN